jgi:hypothetical protein
MAARRDELFRHKCQRVGLDADGFADPVQKATGILSLFMMSLRLCGTASLPLAAPALR